MWRHKLVALFLAVLLLTAAGCGGQPTAPGGGAGSPAPAGSQSAGNVPGGPQPGGKLIVGMQYEPVTLDPHVSGQANAFRILINALDSLVYVDDKGKPHPALAESWEATPDGKQYTFKLRKGVKFHDGTPLNAQAVKFSFDRIMDPKLASQSAISTLRPYEKSEVVDDSTIKVFLKEPSAVWLRNMGSAAAAPVSPAAVEKLGKDFARTPVGSGPFIVKEWKEKESVRLVRNPDYNWASPAFNHKGQALLEEITFKFIPESQVRFATLETGETNAIEDVPAQFVAQVEKDTKKFTMLKVPYPGSPRQFMINTRQFPTSELAVRQAILHAINSEVIIKTLAAGAYPPGNGPMNAATPGSTKGIYRKFYPYDTGKAEQILDQAGWKDGADGIRTKDGKRLELVANALADVPEYGELTQIVQAQLREIGMDVKIKSLARSPWYASNAKGDYNIVGMALWSTDPDMLRTLYRTEGSVFTWSHYKNPEFDKLVDDAVKVTNDDARRMQMYATAQETLMKDAVVLPIYDQMNLLATQGNVKRIAFDQNAYPRYYAAYFEKR